MKLKVLNSQTLSEFQELDLFLTIRMEGECLIGRSPNSGLVLDSPDVSRLHGKFFLQNGDYYYCDLGSRNGSLVNGKIAETNQKYVLKPGDVIRLGEFVLMLEEMSSPDLPETVVRVIDAPVVSNSLQNQQIPPLPKQEEKVPEVAAQEVPNLRTPDPQHIGQFTTEEQASEVVNPQVAPVSEEVTYTQINEYTFIQSAQVANEISESTLATPQLEQQVPVVADDVSEQITPQLQQHIQPTAEEPSVEVVVRQAQPATEEPIDAQTDKLTSLVPPEQDNQVSQNAIATQQPEQEVVAVTDDVTEQITPNSQQSIQPATEELAVEVVVRQAQPATEEPIDAQTNELISLVPPEQDNQVSQNAIATQQPEQEVVAVTDDVTEQITPNSQQSIQPATEELAVEVVVRQAQPATEEPIDAQTNELISLVPPEQDNQVSQNAIATQQPEQEVVAVTDDVTEQITPNSQQSIQPATEELAVEVVVRQAQPATEEPIDAQTNELISLVPPEQDNQVSQNAIATQELEQEVVAVTDDVTEQTTPQSQQIEQPAIEESPEVVVKSPDVAEDVIESETPEFIDKYVVLIAHDSKKSELAEIVAQHQKFFSKCLTLASSSISDLVAQQSGITISQQLPAATSGGYQTIASMVSSGDLLAVIFLRDLLMPQPGQANEEALLRLCNINNLLVATNSSTAEAIVHYLEVVCK
ncbi:hypothetical protein DP114_34205 (plasmid) [Brasilonema sennae CENA114]|uniref:FHA domain-containing protein n=1 Tax=Brasilonema sennae CENA114 TaxID=415709 RepID=A0A856MT44_9CYAN|nr:FHA domain-containing protein [Brasilonema sennae]QDL12797.1 hypothetical protein DP114_34205 [Brasilonema sennae CENA114]